MQIVLATKNKHKVEELKALTTDTGVTIISLADWEEASGINLEEPEESGTTFLANALLKAQYYAQQTQLPALADDSGLSVPALNGSPGVRSARYGGPGLSDEARYQTLLRKLKGRQQRRAFFATNLALAWPDNRFYHWSGYLNGHITRFPRGENGFGYDPIFRPRGQRQTLAQLSPAEKNAISHRRNAINAFRLDLPKLQLN